MRDPELTAAYPGIRLKMSARKFRVPPVPRGGQAPPDRVNTIIVPASPPSTLNPQPSTILWLSPQQLADIRIQYEIDEMVAGRRPAQRTPRSARSDATPTSRHANSD